MSLLDELAAPSSVPCKLCTFIQSRPEAEQAEWHTELSKPVTAVGNTAVVRALRRRLVELDEHSVRRHRERHER